jgi:RNA recognition motif-containing protein
LKDPKTGSSRGFGFVDYETVEEATSAKKQTNNLVNSDGEDIIA